MNRLLALPATEPRTPPPEPYVPERHTGTILAHVIRNLQDLPGPVLLGIDGPPGVGKTFGLAEALRRGRVSRITLCGADLESPEAGRPALRLRRAYLTAALAIAHRRPAALVLEDLDATLGRFDDATYT